MKIGDLVKWVLGGDEYGDLGIVVDIYSNGNYQVYWIKDDNLGNHGEETEHIQVLDTNFG